MHLQSHLKAIVKGKYQSLNDLVLPINLSYRRTLDLLDLNMHYSSHIDHLHDNTFEEFPPVPFEDLLKCNCNHERSQRIVLTFGDSGIGKTTAVQKCALDWAEGRAHAHVDLLFPIPFWELCLLKEEKLSLIQLLKLFFPDLPRFSAKSLSGKNVWFVLDELDDELEFQNCYVGDVNQVTGVETLLPNLIKGNLLPNAHIWVTTRYASINCIHYTCLLKEIEIQGFNDEQKEQHIRTLVGDDSLSNRVIDHIKISKSLYYMCRIPPMCTIMATVLKKHVKANDYKIRPMTLTQIYSSLIEESQLHFIQKHTFGDCPHGYMDLAIWWTYDKELNEKAEIEVAEVSAFAREHPLVLREEKSVCGKPIFFFSHVSILEYFIAVAKLNEETANNPPEQFLATFLKIMKKWDGNLRMYDICFRFFFGLLKERGILHISDPFFVEIKKEILNYLSDDTNGAQLQWLMEVDSQALLNDVEMFENTGHLPILNITVQEWMQLVLMIRNVHGICAKFELELSSRCDEKVLRSLPALLKSRKAMLRFSNLSDICCPALASVLGTKESHLRELDLGFNSITDSGVESLVLGLSDQDCRLKSLSLQGCELTPSACEHLATALKLGPNLKELNLSCNDIGDMGLKHLASGLESPKCQLQTLRLSQCDIKKEGGFHLASALEKNPDHLKWLDLSINRIGNMAANELFSKFDISRLRKLEIYGCGLTECCCTNLSHALKLEKSNLVELNLSSNDLKDAGAYLISTGLSAWSRLEKLNISRCGITKLGGFYLSKVLSCISALYNDSTQKGIGWQATELREMDLSMNKLTDEGAVYLSAGLKSPYSHFRRLSLIDCGLTGNCCSDLASQLASSECPVAELDLSSNNIQDKGLKKLCVALKSPKCALQKLFLRNCGLSSKCVPFFNTALRTNCNLTELFLMGNKLEDSAIKVLLEMTNNNAYKLTTVDVSID